MFAILNLKKQPGIGPYIMLQWIVRTCGYQKNNDSSIGYRARDVLLPSEKCANNLIYILDL